MKQKFFFFGSFDPFTRSDFDAVISQMEFGGFSEGVIAVDVDYSKPSLFSLRMREEMIEESLKWYDKVNKTDYASRIKVISFSGVPVYKAVKLNATTLITLENPHKAIISSAIAHNILDYSLAVDEMSFDAEDDFAIESRNDCEIVKYLYLHKEYIMLQRYLTPAVHNKLMSMALKDEYLECCRGSYIPWEDFVRDVSSRAYHNLSHIAYMLNKYRFFKEEVFDKEQHFDNLNFKSAIFFHDYIANDEEKSFKYSMLSDRCKGLFLATKHGDDAPQNLSKAEQLIRDLDLAILADTVLYEDYKDGIRIEYADVADDVYATKRIEVLNSLIEEVENAKNFSEKEKKRAYGNLTKEKRSLQKQLFKNRLKRFFSRKG